MTLDAGENFLLIEQMVKAPWYLWMFNTADFWHVRTIHLDFSKLITGVPFDVRLGPRGSSHRLTVSAAQVERYERISKKRLRPDFSHHLIYPNTSLTSFLDVFYSEEKAEPMGDSCWVTTKFFFSKKNPIPRSVIPAVGAANGKILDEDRKIVESWATSYRKTGNWLAHEERLRDFEAYLESGACPFPAGG